MALGTHSKNYTLGRGEIYFDRFAAGTEVGEGLRYFGNTPEFGVTIETEKLDHFNADAGVRELDDSVDLEVTRTGALTADHIDMETLALFFFGSTSTQVQDTDPVVDEVIGEVKQGRYYQIGATSANPTGVRKVTSVTVDAEAVLVTVTTDYILDADLGLLYIVPGGGIEDGDEVTVSYTPGAYSRDRVISGSTAVEGAIKFVAVNPKGDNIDYYLPKVKISPNGDYQMKGEEWQTIPLNIEILKKTGLEAIYADGRPYVAA